MSGPCMYDPTGKLKCHCKEKYKEWKRSGPHSNKTLRIKCDSAFIRTRIPSTVYLANYTEVDMDSGKLDEISCASCGGKTFEAFGGSYWTGLKCSNCGTSSTIHDG